MLRDPWSADLIEYNTARIAFDYVDKRGTYYLGPWNMARDNRGGILTASLSERPLRPKRPRNKARVCICRGFSPISHKHKRI